MPEAGDLPPAAVPGTDATMAAMVSAPRDNPAEATSKAAFLKLPQFLLDYISFIICYLTEKEHAPSVDGDLHLPPSILIL